MASPLFDLTARLRSSRLEQGIGKSSPHLACKAQVVCRAARPGLRGAAEIRKVADTHGHSLQHLGQGAVRELIAETRKQ